MWPLFSIHCGTIVDFDDLIIVSNFDPKFSLALDLSPKPGFWKLLQFKAHECCSLPGLHLLFYLQDTELRRNELPQGDWFLLVYQDRVMSIRLFFGDMCSKKKQSSITN